MLVFWPELHEGRASCPACCPLRGPEGSCLCEGCRSNRGQDGTLIALQSRFCGQACASSSLHPYNYHTVQLQIPLAMRTSCKIRLARQWRQEQQNRHLWTRELRKRGPTPLQSWP